jgi:glutathione synthase/RimK-type ligase-like ATP-grasp enzyme
MYKSIVVVDKLERLPQIDAIVIDFAQYLSDYPKAGEPKTRIINLCSTSKYLSEGYYCSLLAEARQHKVLPSVNCINDLDAINTAELSAERCLVLPKTLLQSNEPQELLVYFGWTENPDLKKVAKHVFERLPSPILSLHITPSQQSISVTVRSLGCHELPEAEWPVFAQRIENYTQTKWRNHYNKRAYRWDMAILVDEKEKTPPSDAKALKNFVKAAEQVGIRAELISAKQAKSIGHYDALFIRETTAINHHTYRLARRAEREGLVVIDDAQSILRCCNKVYLHDAFSYHQVPSPKSQFISDASQITCEKLVAHFGFPMVLKLPESAFSLGVFKVEDQTQLQQKLQEMLQLSALVLVQEYIYTEYDWRIGVLNGKAIYACRYFMARNHWQIYNHSSKKNFSGDFETLPTFEVPKPVLDAAMKASLVIGKSLYGVDVKQVGNKAYVIEVNDNPSIESKVEDLYLGKELYMIIMQEFANRLENRGRQ